MNDQSKPNSRRGMQFRRASRFLWPYRKLVGISVVAAIFVGLFLTSGLGAVLPIFQILINGDTVPNWVGRQTASQRLGLLVADDPRALRVIQVKPDQPAAAAGIKPGEELAADQYAID